MPLPLVAAGLLGGLVQVAGSIAGRVLLALGFGYVAYTGISATLTALKSQVITLLGGAPSNVLIIMSILNIDKAVSIIFSAYAARLVLKGITSDTVKRLIVK